MGLEPVRLGYHINYDGWMFKDSEIDEERALLAIKIIWLQTQRGKKRDMKNKGKWPNWERSRIFAGVRMSFFSFFYFALKEREDIQIISLKLELLSWIKRRCFLPSFILFPSRKWWSFHCSRRRQLSDQKRSRMDTKSSSSRISLDICGEVWN